MADETLFGRGRGDRSDDAPDVERVFSRAVERQLDEQRELNRLVQETTDRLAALEEGLRTFRDQTATNLTGLRAEMQDQTTRLGEQVGERIQQVAAEVDRLRNTGTDHQVRLVQLAEAAESAIGALESRHVQLTDELTEVNEQLRRDEGPDADALVAALDRFEVSLASRFDERFGALSHRLGRLHEQLQEQLEEQRRDGEGDVDLVEEFGEVRARIEALREHTDDARRQAAERGAAQRRDEQQRLAERLRDELRHELLRAITPLLEEHQTSPEEIAQAVDQVVANRVGALDDGLERLATLVRARAEELQTGLEPLEEVRQRLEGVDALHRRLDALEQVRRQLDPLGGRLDDLGAQLDGFDSRLAVLEGHVGTQTRAVASFAEEHERALEQVADAAAATGPELVAHVRQALTPIADDLVDLQEQLRLVRASSGGDEEALAALRERLTEVIGVRLGEVRHALTEHQETVDAAMRATSEAVGEHRRSVDAAMRATSDAVGEHRDAVDTGLRATREAMSEHRESVAADLRADRAALEGEVGALLEAVETRLDDLDQILGTTLPETLSRQRQELTATLSEPLSDATERLVAAREELRGVAAELGGLPGELDEHLVTSLDRAVGAAREEARTATRQVVEAADRLDAVRDGLTGLETALVAYLESRDARLEQERMEVLRDLVEEFAEGLSRRDRRRLARRLDDVRQKVGLSPSSAGDQAGPGGGSDSASEAGPTDGPDGGEQQPGLLAALLGEPAPPESETFEAQPAEVEAAEVEDRDADDRDVDDRGVEDRGAGLLQQLFEEPDVEETVEQTADEEPIEAEAADEAHRCPECGFVAGNAGGLASHRRTHT